MVVSNDESCERGNLTLLQETGGRHTIFVWIRLNRRKMKDFERLELNIPEPDFISDPTHQ